MAGQDETLADVRARRHALQAEEDAVSFVRRMAQGRMDLTQDERRRRAAGGDAPDRSLSERLAEVFGQEHGGGSARPPRETNVPTDHPLMVQLEELCDEHGFAGLEQLSDRALSELEAALDMFEKECSRQRHELFDQIDALTADIVRRVREGGAGQVAGDPAS